jgi:Ca2+-binding RTX toxin-like protein
MFGKATETAQKAKKPQSPPKPSIEQPVASEGDLAVSLNGEATAIGENTSAEAILFGRAYDRGGVQVAFGTAWLSAVSVSSAGQPAYAATNGFVGFAGADYSYTSTQKLTGGGDHRDGSWSAERSQTDFVALNVVGWDVQVGSVEHYGEASMGAGQQIPTINGNVASYHIDAKAYGDDSFVHADTMSLALDGFSSSTNSATIGVGSDHAGAKPILCGSANDIILTSDVDTFVNAGMGNDLVRAGTGDDWIISGAGNDLIFTGGGNNTVLAGTGNDAVTAGNGDDWVFGGDGKDLIAVGSGNNIVNGGDGNDTIVAGGGDDVIIGGTGKDVIAAGDGRNFIRMGLGGSESDGDDAITAGRGQDLFFLDGCFGRDTIWGFATGQGDRLVVEDGYDASASIARSKADLLDLVITLGSGRTASVLTLDNFFLCNPGYAAPFSRAALTKAQEAVIRQDIFMDGADGQLADASGEYFAIGDYLGLLG